MLRLFSLSLLLHSSATQVFIMIVIVIMVIIIVIIRIFTVGAAMTTDCQ
jgi:hypothetical protein